MEPASKRSRTEAPWTSEPGTASSLFGWAKVAVSSLEVDDVTSSLLGGRNLFTSCCAGVGSAEAAAMSLKAAVVDVLGIDQTLRCKGSVEKDPACQRNLLDLASDAHIWSDIFKFFPTAVPAKTMSPEAKVAEFASKFQTAVPCTRHNAFCELTPTHGDITGTPCTPWSRAGARQGRPWV